MGFELWWVLVVFPLISLWNALTGVWGVLLRTPCEYERKVAIELAFVKAFVSIACVAGMWIVPWPYKALCWLPSVVPFTLKLFGNVFHISLNVKQHKRL